MNPQKNIIGYKFISKDMKSLYGNCTWKRNVWKKHDGVIIPCESGFHACLTPRQVLSYVYGDRLFVVEARGEIKHVENDKFVASEMRLVKELPTKKIAVEYALKCAWRVVKTYEKFVSGDKRVRKAVQAARTYLARPNEKNRLACETAASAAKSAAWSAKSAAESAALSAAWSAKSAAKSAAWSAAWSAKSAAKSAALSAESAAKSAAKSAEIAWQEKTLNNIIKRYLRGDK